MTVILATNDDGIHADGLRALADAIRPLGEVTVIAPDREQSATSHSLTLHRPLRIRKVAEGILSVDGTPTDCVLLGVHGFSKQPPTLVVSGINHGPNMGNPSIAFSLATWEPADFAPAGQVAAALVRLLLTRGLRPGTCLNVNIPPLPFAEIRGVRVARLGKRVFRDVIVEKTDPRGKSYYWIGGENPTWEPDEASDFHAVSNGYVAVTPLSFELTDYKAIVELETMGLTIHDS